VEEVEHQFKVVVVVLVVIEQMSQVKLLVEGQVQNQHIQFHLEHILLLLEVEDLEQVRIQIHLKVGILTFIPHR
jgi:hypothetical protein